MRSWIFCSIISLRAGHLSSHSVSTPPSGGEVTVAPQAARALLFVKVSTPGPLPSVDGDDHQRRGTAGGIDYVASRQRDDFNGKFALSAESPSAISGVSLYGIGGRIAFAWPFSAPRGVGLALGAQRSTILRVERPRPAQRALVGLIPEHTTTRPAVPRRSYNSSRPSPAAANRGRPGASPSGSFSRPRGARDSHLDTFPTPRCDEIRLMSPPDAARPVRGLSARARSTRGRGGTGHALAIGTSPPAAPLRAAPPAAAAAPDAHAGHPAPHPRPHRFAPAPPAAAAAPDAHAGHRTSPPAAPLARSPRPRRHRTHTLAIRHLTPGRTASRPLHPRPGGTGRAAGHPAPHPRPHRSARSPPGLRRRTHTLAWSLNFRIMVGRSCRLRARRPGVPGSTTAECPVLLPDRSRRPIGVLVGATQGGFVAEMCRAEPQQAAWGHHRLRAARGPGRGGYWSHPAGAVYWAASDLNLALHGWPEQVGESAVGVGTQQLSVGFPTYRRSRRNLSRTFDSSLPICHQPRLETRANQNVAAAQRHQDDAGDSRFCRISLNDLSMPGMGTCSATTPRKEDVKKHPLIRPPPADEREGRP